jgi:hypothetical protein
MSAGKPPLWACPRCGRQFANRNQSHECTTMTLAEHLADKTPLAVELFRAFEARVRACGPVRLHPVKTRVGFITRMSFAGASLFQRWIEVGLILPYRSDDPRFHKVQTFGARSHGHWLRVRTLEELDDQLDGWLHDAYRVGLQEAADQSSTRR